MKNDTSVKYVQALLRTGQLCFYENLKFKEGKGRKGGQVANTLAKSQEAFSYKMVSVR